MVDGDEENSGHRQPLKHKLGAVGQGGDQCLRIVSAGSKPELRMSALGRKLPLANVLLESGKKGERAKESYQRRDR